MDKVEKYVMDKVHPNYILISGKPKEPSMDDWMEYDLPHLTIYTKYYFILMEKHINHINSLPLDEALKELNINSLDDYNHFQFHRGHKYFDYNTIDKVADHFKPKKKRKPKLVLDFPDIIKEDYQHFKINPYVRNSWCQDEILDFSFYTIDKLLKFSFSDNKRLDGNNNYFTQLVYWTEDLHEQVIENNSIINFTQYEYILFNHIICDENLKIDLDFVDEENDKEYDVYNFNIVKEFYHNNFRPYFINRYKDKLNIDNEDTSASMTRKLHQFDIHYKRVFPNKFRKQDNYNEYNAYSKTKSNLKKSYKRYLDGEAVDTLPINDKLRLMIYIIEDCSFVKF